MEDEPLDFVVVSGDELEEDATSTAATQDAPTDPVAWTFDVVDRPAEGNRSITTQELFGDIVEPKPAEKAPPPHRRPFSFLIPGVHLLGKTRPVIDAPTDNPVQETAADITDTDTTAAASTNTIADAPPDPVTLKSGGTGWNIRVTAETVIEPDTAQSDSPTLELDLTPPPNPVVQVSLHWVAAIPRTYVPALEPGKPLPRSRRQRLLALRFRLAATSRATGRLAFGLVSVSGHGINAAVRGAGARVRFHPRPIHISRRLLIIGALLGIVLAGTAAVVAVTGASRTNPNPSPPIRHASPALSILPTTATNAAPGATDGPPAPTAAPPSAAEPAPIPVVLAPVHNSNPAPTPPPAPAPTATPVPTPTPPVQLSDSASGYLSTNAAVHTCSPFSGFTTASLSGPDGFTRSCTYTFTENVAGTISAKLTSTGDPLGSPPVVQANGYCIMLYRAPGTTPLVKTCTASNSAGPATFTQNTSTLPQTTGTFRIEVEAMSAKTSFNFSLTHY